jgi:aminoglycoside phosphotransferase (APT) family kinase protein
MGTRPGYELADLHRAISQVHPHQLCPIAVEHFCGGQCSVLKCAFADGHSWAVRISLREANSNADVHVESMKQEIAIIQELEQKGSRWAPTYCGSSLSFSNDIQRPFIALRWIEGAPLHWSDSSPERKSRNEILQRLAAIQAERIELTLQSSAQRKSNDRAPPSTC